MDPRPSGSLVHGHDWYHGHDLCALPQRDIREVGGGPGASPGPDSSPQARRSAAANSGQVPYRSVGTLASAFAITSSTAAGRSGRRLVSAGGGAEIWAHMTATDSSLTNGGWPVSMVNAEQASAYSSARPVTARASICSGAM